MQNDPATRRTRRGGGLLLAAAILLAGCQTVAATTVIAPSHATAAKAASPYRTITVSDNTWTDATDPTALPLGDDKVVTAPAVGDLDSCQTTFPTSGGATSYGSWLDVTNGTWNAETKPAVEGTVHWKGTFTVSSKGSNRVIKTNDLPKGQTTGTYPISPSDPAYQYDQNPNSIRAQKLSYKIPLDPTAATAPSCTSLGPIGVMDDGVVLLNALDAEGRDAGAHELLDHCDGHPMMAGMYHYHSVSPCLAPTTPDSATLVGYALDGFGIYVERNGQGNLPTDADLDACHGRTSQVLFDGRLVDMYHYDATWEYPYTVGCYMGTPAATAPMPPDP